MSDDFRYPDIAVIHHSSEHVSRNSCDFLLDIDIEVLYGTWPGCIHIIFEVSPQEVVAWVETGGVGWPVIVGAMTDNGAWSEHVLPYTLNFVTPL